MAPYRLSFCNHKDIVVCSIVMKLEGPDNLISHLCNFINLRPFKKLQFTVSQNAPQHRRCLLTDIYPLSMTTDSLHSPLLGSPTKLPGISIADLNGFTNHLPFHHQLQRLNDGLPLCPLPIPVTEVTNGIDGLPMHGLYQQHSPLSGLDTDTYSCSQSGLSDCDSLPSRPPKSGKGERPVALWVWYGHEPGSGG